MQETEVKEMKPKITQVHPITSTNFHLLQIEDSVVIQVKQGRNILKNEWTKNDYQSSNEYAMDLLFTFKEKILYSATDENYWCPTCERLIRRYAYNLEEEILQQLSNYRQVMGKSSIFQEIIEANKPLLELLPSGSYTLSLRKVFPTYGEQACFIDFLSGSLTASADSYYEFMDNEPMTVEASTIYMLPTQEKERLNEDTLKDYRKKDMLGYGVVWGFCGFLGCLLDGHHKAMIAYERNQPLDCFVIEPYIEGQPLWKKNEGVFPKKRFPEIPTISEFCFLQNFIDEKEMNSQEELLSYFTAILERKMIPQEGEMDQFIHLIAYFFPERLKELYSIISTTYPYKSLRERFFHFLARQARSLEIEKIMLDFLIYDDYESPQATKICEDYFR